MLDVALLGTGGMMPLPNRFLTSLLCRLNGKMLLIDCGEGTQVTNKMLGWGFKNIDVICITHFHGDHVTGLCGMLLTIGNANRTEPLTIIGPKGLREVCDGLLVVARDLPFSILYIELEADFEEMKIGDFKISAIKADHRITCYGYSIEIIRKGKFDLDKAKRNEVPKSIWSILQKGEIAIYEGKEYSPEMVLGNDRKGIKVSYITDTRPMEEMIEFIKNSNLFICEGIYGEDEKLSKAKEYKHMLYSEAASLAKTGLVEELWLTHFSPAIKTPEDFLPVAKDIFPNTQIGEDRKTLTINFEC